MSLVLDEWRCGEPIPFGSRRSDARRFSMKSHGNESELLVAEIQGWQHGRIHIASEQEFDELFTRQNRTERRTLREGSAVLAEPRTATPVN